MEKGCAKEQMTKAKMKKKFNTLEWNVLIHDFNRHKFVYCNVLREDLLDDILRRMHVKDAPCTKQDIQDVVQRWAMYHYWSKCEYEFIASSLFGDDELKVDAYMQLEMNIDRLTEYLIKELELDVD